MIAAVALGLLAGIVAGLLGVGGGVLFVPALTVALGLGQVEAEATSLLAVVPVAAVGAWRQHGYGHVRAHDAGLIVLGSIAGVLAGVALANELPERALRTGFAALLLLTAARLARGALASSRRPSG